MQSIPIQSPPMQQSPRAQSPLRFSPLLPTEQTPITQFPGPLHPSEEGVQHQPTANEDSSPDGQPPQENHSIAAVPPTFEPLFTLISSPQFQTPHHPKVHYIFSTDDPDGDLITAAALQTLSVIPPLPVGTRKERYIIVDLDSTGTRVVGAHSMANDWQIISAEIGPAPSWEGEGGGRMLKIEGVDEAQEENEGAFVGLEGLMDIYGRKLEELRRVVEAGGDRGKLVGERPQSQLGKGEP